MSFSVATYTLTNYVPRFLFFSFLLLPSISIDDIGATSGVFYLSFVSLFPNGFLLCDHGLDL